MLTGARIGWAGVGRMGTPLCRRILAAGATLTVADPNAAAVEAMVAAGATAADGVAGLARTADVICSMVPNDVVLMSVAADLAPALRPGHILMDLSTVSPDTSALVAELLAPTGVAYLRCPVSGSTATAESGALTIFASGPDEALDRVAPLLATLGKETLRLGNAEEARVIKLLVNMVVAITPAVIGEALAFGSRFGLDWPTMLDAFSRSVVASPLLAYKTEMLKARDWTPTADVDLLSKDLDLALMQGGRAGVPMPFSALTMQINNAFSASGEGGLDFFRVATWPERLLTPGPR